MKKGFLNKPAKAAKSKKTQQKPDKSAFVEPPVKHATPSTAAVVPHLRFPLALSRDADDYRALSRFWKDKKRKQSQILAAMSRPNQVGATKDQSVDMVGFVTKLFEMRALYHRVPEARPTTTQIIQNLIRHVVKCSPKTQLLALELVTDPTIPLSQMMVVLMLGQTGVPTNMGTAGGLRRVSHRADVGWPRRPPDLLASQKGKTIHDEVTLGQCDLRTSRGVGKVPTLQWGKELNMEELENEFVKKGLPVVIRGLYNVKNENENKSSDDTKACGGLNFPPLQQWKDFHYLKTKCGENKVKVRFTQFPCEVNKTRCFLESSGDETKEGKLAMATVLEAYEKYRQPEVKKNNPTPEYYLGKNVLKDDLPELYAELYPNSQSEIKEDDNDVVQNSPEALFQHLFGKGIDIGPVIYTGCGGNITPLHYDSFENLSLCLFGQKRFWLYPPADASCLYPNCFPSEGYSRASAPPFVAPEDFKELVQREGMERCKVARKASSDEETLERLYHFSIPTDSSSSPEETMRMMMLDPATSMKNLLPLHVRKIIENDCMKSMTNLIDYKIDSKTKLSQKTLPPSHKFHGIEADVFGDTIGPFEACLKAGDLLYLPIAWWHCVEGGVEPNMILNWWFCMHRKKVSIDGFLKEQCGKVDLGA